MVTIAVPTYNRLDFVKKMAASLYRSDLSIPHNIRIYDDCSTEYGTNELSKIFPAAASITRNKTNVRADTNMYLFYRDFLSTTDEYLFNADSDLIFQKGWLPRSLDMIKETDGVLTLFNANSHPAKKIINEKFCIKDTIGAAGTLFTRSRIEELMRNFFIIDKIGVRSFDWKWSNYFTQHNIPIYCVNESLVQHIGYTGQTTVFGAFDFGKNFTVDSPENGQIINDMFELFLEKLSGNEEAGMENLASSGAYQKTVFSNIKHRSGLGLHFIMECFKTWLYRDKKASDGTKMTKADF
jgi:glycosyltransferase involved in cell wall biosynthesis